MALEKSTEQDKLEIVAQLGYKVIQVRTATVIKDDGDEISRAFRRHVVNPNSDLTNESDEVKALAAIYFTEDAKAKHKTAQAAAAGPITE